MSEFQYLDDVRPDDEEINFCAVTLATHYVRVIPLPGQHPKSVPDNAYTSCKVQSWPVYVGRTRFHFNCANNVSRCALPAISPSTVSGNHDIAIQRPGSRIC